MMELEDRKKLAKAYIEASDIFHKEITPNLPKEIQDELKICEDFSYSWEGPKLKVMLSVNGKRFNITEWYKPVPTIFDVYDK